LGMYHFPQLQETGRAAGSPRLAHVSLPLSGQVPGIKMRRIEERWGNILSRRSALGLAVLTSGKVKSMYRLLLAISCCSVICAWSQTTSALIFGTVSDSSGAVLAGASVKATKTDTQVTQIVATNTDGNYVFPGLAPGAYSVSCEQKGFRGFVREGVLLEVNQRARVDIALQIGEAREMVS